MAHCEKYDKLLANSLLIVVVSHLVSYGRARDLSLQ